MTGDLDFSARVKTREDIPDRAQAIISNGCTAAGKMIRAANLRFAPIAVHAFFAPSEK